MRHTKGGCPGRSHIQLMAEKYEGVKISWEHFTASFELFILQMTRSDHLQLRATSPCRHIRSNLAKGSWPGHAPFMPRLLVLVQAHNI